MATNIHNRIKRLSGQLQSLQQSIDEGTPCEEVIPQFLAVKGALNGAFEAYVIASLAECGTKDKEKLTQLISTLIKK